VDGLGVGDGVAVEVDAKHDLDEVAVLELDLGVGGEGGDVGDDIVHGDGGGEGGALADLDAVVGLVPQRRHGVGDEFVALDTEVEDLFPGGDLGDELLEDVGEGLACQRCT
jgi:hypothetical protein